MTYVINQDVRLITTPILVHIGDKTLVYESGKTLAKEKFDKWYVISKIDVEENKIAVYLKENHRANELNWVGEEAVTFF